MATTKYEILWRYYNVDMKMPITNIINETWVSCFDADKISKIPAKDMDKYSVETFEYYTKTDAVQERKIQDLLIYGNNSFNPKFNMFFVYKARDIKYSKEGTTAFPYMLIDQMERIPLSPWFVHSTHSSLNVALTKARAIAKYVGHENIKIGKVIPLDQYIDII